MQMNDTPQDARFIFRVDILQPNEIAPIQECCLDMIENKQHEYATGVVFTFGVLAGDVQLMYLN